MVSEHLENSRPAFEFAIRAGFSSFETDLRMTKDHEIVLSHDPDLKRVLSKNISIEESTRKELESLESPSGEKLMFIDELLRDFQDYRWTFDIKEEAAEECLRILSHKIQSLGLLDWIHQKVKFLFWNAKHEAEILKYFPKAQMYAMESECRWAAFGIIFKIPFCATPESGKTYGLPPQFLGLNLFRQKYVDQYHSQKTQLLGYLPQTKAEAQRALDAGFDEILTDHSFF